MEKIVQICSLSVTGGVDHLVALTDYGGLYRYTPTSPPTGQGTWMSIILPPGILPQEVKLVEKVDDLARLPKGYGLYKRNDNGLFFWERETPPMTSEQFDRMEGAIAGARTDYMIRHPPKPPPKPPLEKQPT